MAAVEQVHLCAGHVAFVGGGLRGLERRVVAAPGDQQRRLAIPQPLLPCGVARDVRLVIEEQVCLDVGLARAVQERELVGPVIRVVILRRKARPDVAQAGRGGREEVLAQRRLMFGAVSPELAAGLPQRSQPVFVGDGVLHDERLDPVGVRQRQPEPDRPAVVLHEQHVAGETEPAGEAVDHLGEVVERVGEYGAVGRVAVTEPGVVRCDQVEGVAQPGQQRLPHA